MRKITHIFLSLVIVYATTTSAYANTSIGGWTAVDTIIAGANTTINAVKTSGGKAVKSAITIAPQAGKVGKVLVRGVGVGAVLLAVSQVLGDGVDYVMDPENNRVKYTDLGSAVDPNSPSGTAGVSLGDSTCREYVTSIWGAEIAKQVRFGGAVAGWQYACVYISDGSVFTALDSNPAYVDRFKPTDSSTKYIPIDTVAAQVISNAAAGDVPSQEAVKAAALEGFAAGEHDAVLDAAAEAIPDTGVENPPVTDPAENPPFDDSAIIAAINSLKAMLTGIMSSIGELTGFMNSELPPEKTKEETNVPVDAPPDVKNPNEFDVNYIGFSSQCPTLSPFSVGIGAVSSSMTFDMTPLCNLAVTIRPAIIAIAYFIGLGVIASAIRET